MSITNKLEEIGFYNLREAKESLLKQAIEASTSAGTKLQKEKSFEAFPSFIPTKAPIDRNDIQLITDIGGTSTKVALRDTRGEGVTWRMLFEENNFSLKPNVIESQAFISFSKVLANKIKSGLQELNVEASDVKAFAFIWSNAIVNNPRGKTAISAKVTDVEDYKKGEWFIADLKNGDDLGEMLLTELKSVGFNPSQFLIANDAPLTMKALDNADGGMVVSTGLNGTLVKSLSELNNPSNEEVICNGELGGRFKIDNDLLSQGDWIANDKRANTIELLTAGRFLPLLFTKHIIALAESNCSELKKLADVFNNKLREKMWVEFRAKDMNLLFSDKQEFIERRNPLLKEYLTNEVLEVLTELSKEIFERSAYLAAIVAFATISNRIESKDKFLIALDSRLAREVSFYFEKFESNLKSISKDKKITILGEIVLPIEVESGKISVPMQGAAKALDSLGIN